VFSKVTRDTKVGRFDGGLVIGFNVVREIDGGHVADTEFTLDALVHAAPCANL